MTSHKLITTVHVRYISSKPVGTGLAGGSRTDRAKPIAFAKRLHKKVSFLYRLVDLCAKNAFRAKSRDHAFAFTVSLARIRCSLKFHDLQYIFIQIVHAFRCLLSRIVGFADINVCQLIPYGPLNLKKRKKNARQYIPFYRFYIVHCTYEIPFVLSKP